MNPLVLLAALFLCACPSKPVTLSGSAGGAAKVDSQPKESKVVPLSGAATAKGSAK